MQSLTHNCFDYDVSDALISDQLSLFFQRSLSAHLPPADFVKLQQTTVLVAGLGGGSNVLELLARKGFRHFIIADPDIYEPHNIRQRGSLISTQGRGKAEVMGERLLDLCPQVQVTVVPEGVTHENVADLVGHADYIVDSIDFEALAVKAKLYQAARDAGKYVCTAPSIVNGAVLFIFPPDGVTFEDFFDYDSRLPIEVSGPRMLKRLFPSYPPEAPEALCRAAACCERTFPLDAVGVDQAAVLVVTALENLVLGRDERVVMIPQVIQVDLSNPHHGGFQIVDFTAVLEVHPHEDADHAAFAGATPHATGATRLGVAKAGGHSTEWVGQVSPRIRQPYRGDLGWRDSPANDLDRADRRFHGCCLGLRGGLPRRRRCAACIRRWEPGDVRSPEAMWSRSDHPSSSDAHIHLVESSQLMGGKWRLASQSIRSGQNDPGLSGLWRGNCPTV